MNLLFLTVLIFALPDPNAVKAFDLLTKHWLEPVAFIERTYYVPAENDPNLLLKITERKPVDFVDMNDLAALSRVWPGGPVKYYSCKKEDDEPIYHLLECRFIRESPLFGVGIARFELIEEEDLPECNPCQYCLPKKHLAEMLKKLNDPNAVKAIMEIMK